MAVKCLVSGIRSMAPQPTLLPARLSCSSRLSAVCVPHYATGGSRRLASSLLRHSQLYRNQRKGRVAALEDQRPVVASASRLRSLNHVVVVRWPMDPPRACTAESD